MHRTVILGLAALLWCGPAAARPAVRPEAGPAALQRTLAQTVRQYNQQLKRGRPAMDLGLVFRMVGRTLERTNGDVQAAQRMADRAARWSAGRGSTQPRLRLSPQVVRAVRTASTLHQHQLRKGSSVPYMAHLLGVAGIVMRSGGSEKAIIAALLHDAVEDQGGSRTMKRIRRQFGPGVAGIVGAATEQPGSWRARKLHKINSIAAGKLSPDELRVKLADSLHNSGTMIKGARREGPAFWHIFHGKRDGTLWYYDSMVRSFKTATASGDPQLRRLSEQLERQVARLHQAAGTAK